MHNKGLKRRYAASSDRVSGRVLAVLVALSAVLFGAFFVVGYDLPYAADPQFNAPLLTDALLVYTYALSIAAVIAAVVSMVHGVVRHGGSRYETHGVPSGRIALAVAGLLVVTLCLTFALGSDEPLLINGKVFSEAGWLKLTDMFINTSLVLGAVAVLLVAFGVSGLGRRINSKH